MKKRRLITFSISLLLILSFATFLYLKLSSINKNFPEGGIFEVNNNDTLKTVSNRLYDDNYINSPLFFRLTVSYFGKDKNIAIGLYRFDKKISSFDVAKKISSGKYDMPRIVITVPEGFTNVEISERVIKSFDINQKDFLELASSSQGYLFPETYYFTGSESVEDIILTMKDEFFRRVGEINHRDLVLASIVEAEANNAQDMNIVASILYERLRIGMRLQVDVATSTYRTIKLPDMPINNPGENAIKAVRNYVRTEYLYYLTGKDGKMYYAKTFDEHRANIKKYLK